MIDNDQVIQLVKDTLEDKDNYGKIVDLFQERIINYCQRIVNNREDAKECAQDVFVKVFFALRSFNPKYPFSPWIYKIAYNTCITFLKRNKIVYSIDYERTIAEEGDPFLLVEKEEKYTLLHKAIAQLDEKYRQVIELYYLKELSYEEISTHLHLNLNTVRTHLKRGKMQLRHYL